MASNAADQRPVTDQVPQWARELAPLDTAPLFRPLLQELTGLLRALSAADWERPTLAGAWKVRDVAAHLIDGDLRKIAVYRDDHRLPMDAPIHSDRDLARFVNRLNAGGVAFGARLSPGSSSIFWRSPESGSPN